MDCQNIAFSQNQSQKRIEKVLRVMPVQVLKKLLFFALYVLGARLNIIASLVDMPTESGKTTISRVMKDGLPAFHDRRKSVYELPLPDKQNYQATVSIQEAHCAIKFGDTRCQLQIPKNHRVHLKSVLLSLLQADLLSVQTVSSVLGITKAHCRELSAKLIQDGVTQSSGFTSILAISSWYRTRQEINPKLIMNSSALLIMFKILPVIGVGNPAGKARHRRLVPCI